MLFTLVITAFSFFLMTFQRGPAPAGNLRAVKPPFSLFAADQFHLTLFRLFSQPPLRRLGAAAMFASQFPYTAHILSRPALSLLPFLSRSCGLPPRPCSQASFPAQPDFLPPGSFTFAFSFRKLRLTAEAILANRILRPARVLYHPDFPILSLAGSFCRSSFHAATHLSGCGLCVFCL